MSAQRTLRGLIASGRDDAVAIAGHDAPPMTYAGLRSLVDRTVAKLNELGVGRGDRVAIVLPNGPEMAAAFLCVAAGAAAAPLNPAYREDEFDFYLSDLDAKALIVEVGSEFAGAARGAEARRRGHHAHARARRRGGRVPALRRRRKPRRPDAGQPKRTTSRSSSTRRAPPRGRRSCR